MNHGGWRGKRGGAPTVGAGARTGDPGRPVLVVVVEQERKHGTGACCTSRSQRSQSSQAESSDSSKRSSSPASARSMHANGAEMTSNQPSVWAFASVGIRKVALDLSGGPRRARDCTPSGLPVAGTPPQPGLRRRGACGRRPGSRRGRLPRPPVPHCEQTRSRRGWSGVSPGPRHRSLARVCCSTATSEPSWMTPSTVE